MKSFNIFSCLCIAVFLCVLSGCSSTPSENKKTAPPQSVQLNADEQKSYQDALNAIKSEQPDKAISILNKIANNHPGHLGAWINLANSYFAQTKINEAEAALANAAKINPKVAEIYNLQGLIAANKGDYTGAEKNYLNAIQLKDNYPAAHYNLALLYDIYYQAPEKAVVQYDRYLELSDGTDKKTLSWVAELKQKIKRKEKP